MTEDRSTIAKIARPKYAGVLKRDRLFRLLDAGIRQPLIWVAGPDGSGKPALVSSYLRERSLPHFDTDALVEEFYGQLMTCYCRMGLKADAVAVFKRCEKILQDSFGVEPSAQTRQIYRSLFQ